MVRLSFCKLMASLSTALHSRQHDEEVQFCAFDILVEGGDGLRKLPPHLRKSPRITTLGLWYFHSEKNCDRGGPLAILSAAS
jgi:hypothetical protein